MPLSSVTQKLLSPEAQAQLQARCDQLREYYVTGYAAGARGEEGQALADDPVGQLYYHVGLQAGQDGLLPELTTQHVVNTTRQKNVYRFNIRRGCQLNGRRTRKITAHDVDVVAFAALDIRAIGYLRVAAVVQADGNFPSGIEFRTRTREYPGRCYSNGTVRQSWGRYLEYYTQFPESIDEGKSNSNRLPVAVRQRAG